MIANILHEWKVVMMTSKCAFVANSLSIARVIELFENLPDNFVTKAPLDAKDEQSKYWHHV